MNRATGKNKQSGVALVFAILALALLSAIGAAMLYSSGLELGIAGNYRDKQVATYAAVSGLQEAKDRLQPTRDDTDEDKIFSPDGLPSLAYPNVIYLINPKSGETVAPWNTANRYADKDLCHGTFTKSALSISGPEGTPCTGTNSLPNSACTPGSAGCWYAVYNNASSAYAGLYKIDQPLDYKWVRIMLKADNMTSVPVASPGATATGKQVCWDGTNQVQIPAGYTTDCMPIGALARIDLTGGGDGYDPSDPPTITIGPPAAGGIQATATPVISSSATDKVGSITITNPGAGYTAAPTVTLTGGGGTGATAKATIVTGPGVESVNLDNKGPACYSSSSAPTLTLSGGGGGSGATFNVGMTSGYDCISSWSVSVKSGCTSVKGTSATVSGSGGFSGSVTFTNPSSGSPSVSWARIGNPGAGITTLKRYTWTPPTGCTLNISATLGYSVQSIAVGQHGSNYTSAPTITFQQPDAGTSPQATASIGSVPTNIGQIARIDVVTGGSGYTGPPTVTITPTNGAGANGAAVAALSQKGYISAINLTNGGSHYWRVPTVTIGTPGAGATAKAVLGNTTFLSPVYVLTSMAATPSGTLAMTQMEVAPEVRGSGFNLGGALTLDGPNPDFGTPNSNGFIINGNDLDSCGNGRVPAHPSIGVYDDPNNPTTPTALSTVIGELGKPQNYIGAKAAPDVENVFAAMGDKGTTPEGVQAVADAVASLADASHYYTGNQTDSTVDMGAPGRPVVLYIDGNFTASGSTHGYGTLLVTGNVIFSGNWSWDGLILVIGQGSFVANGGGNGQINGTVFVAKTKDTPPTGELPSKANLLDTLGSPKADFSGGGGNGIRYDHCLADAYMAQIPYVPPPSSKPLKVLSTHSLNY